METQQPFFIQETKDGLNSFNGQTHELTAAETLFRDSTDYVGRFLLKGSLVDRYLFDGGYLTAGMWMTKTKGWTNCPPLGGKQFITVNTEGDVHSRLSSRAGMWMTMTKG